MGKSNFFKNTKDIVTVGVVAALYVSITILLKPISYGLIQFRVSEILVLLCYYNPVYIFGVTFGCLISNLNSPFGILDIIIGSLSTFLSGYFISKTKNFFLSTLWASVFSMPVGIMISYLTNAPFFQTIIFVMLSQFIIISVIGYLIFKALTKNERFYNLVKNIK